MPSYRPVLFQRPRLWQLPEAVAYANPSLLWVPLYHARKFSTCVTLSVHHGLASGADYLSLSQPWGIHPISVLGRTCPNYGLLSRLAWAYMMFDVNNEMKLVPEESMMSPEAYATWLLKESEAAPSFPNGYKVLNLWELSIAFWNHISP